MSYRKVIKLANSFEKKLKKISQVDSSIIDRMYEDHDSEFDDSEFDDSSFDDRSFGRYDNNAPKPLNQDYQGTPDQIKEVTIKTCTLNPGFNATIAYAYFDGDYAITHDDIHGPMFGKAKPNSKYDILRKAQSLVSSSEYWDSPNTYSDRTGMSGSYLDQRSFYKLVEAIKNGGTKVNIVEHDPKPARR